MFLEERLNILLHVHFLYCTIIFHHINGYYVNIIFGGHREYGIIEWLLEGDFWVPMTPLIRRSDVTVLAMPILNVYIFIKSNWWLIRENRLPCD